MRAGGTGDVAAPPIRSSATVSAWMLVSRVTGAGRVIVIGAVLGPTYFANTFVATNSVPNLVYLSILGSVLSPVVVPAIVRTTASSGTRGAAELLGRLAGFLLLVMGVASLLLLISSPFIARLLTAGIADPATRSRGQVLTLVMLLFVVPQVMCYIIAALGAAAQQARGRFALAAAAPAVENLGVMTTVAVVAFIYPAGVEIGDAPMGLAITLCVGSTLSVALHMALQLFGAARARPAGPATHMAPRRSAHRRDHRADSPVVGHRGVSRSHVLHADRCGRDRGGRGARSPDRIRRLRDPGGVGCARSGDSRAARDCQTPRTGTTERCSATEIAKVWGTR